MYNVANRQLLVGFCYQHSVNLYVILRGQEPKSLLVVVRK